MAELHFKVPAMACRHCADAIAATVAELVGVGQVEVDPTTKWVAVFGPALDVPAISAAVDRAGHPADL
jgi:copper chaperone CopZ